MIRIKLTKKIKCPQCGTGVVHRVKVWKLDPIRVRSLIACMECGRETKTIFWRRQPILLWEYPGRRVELP